MPLIRARLHGIGAQLYYGLVLQGKKITLNFFQQAKYRCLISDISPGKEHTVAQTNNAKKGVNF